jgi:hypothetical protein
VPILYFALLLGYFQQVLSAPEHHEGFFERLSKTTGQVWSSITGQVSQEIIEELVEQTLLPDLEKFLKAYVSGHSATLETEQDYSLYLKIALNHFKTTPAWHQTYQDNPYATELLEAIITNPQERDRLLPNFEMYFAQESQPQSRLRLISKKPWRTMPKEFRVSKLEVFAHYVVEHGIDLETMKLNEIKRLFTQAISELKNINPYLMNVLADYNQATISSDELQNLKKLFKEQRLEYEKPIAQNERYFQNRLLALQQERRALEEQVVYTIAAEQHKDPDQIVWPIVHPLSRTTL